MSIKSLLCFYCIAFFVVLLSYCTYVQLRRNKQLDKKNDGDIPSLEIPRYRYNVAFVDVSTSRQVIQHHMNCLLQIRC